MCFPLDCWLCMPRTVDDDLAPASRTQAAHRHNGNGGGHYNGNGGVHHGNGNGNGNGGHHYNGNGGHHYNSNGYGYTAHMPAAAEADRKASNDVRRAHGAATGAQEKAAAYPYAGAQGALKQQHKAAAAYPYAGGDGTLKQQQLAAPNGRVAADGVHGARGGAPHYYERAHLPAHREDAADSHYYPAAAATTDHERY